MEENKNIHYDRVNILRAIMQKNGIDAYLIVTDDFHASEYVNDYFKCREYISGFNGSAGTLVITQTEAGLWTDGRYFIQAKNQLASTGITLRKSGEVDVPKIPEYLKSVLSDGQCLGYDGRTISASYSAQIKNTLKDKKVRYEESVDLVGEMWAARPPFPANPVWLLSEKYTGKTRKEKLENLRNEMQKLNAEYFLLAALDDIAWLYNLRGDDICFNPVAMAYTLVEKDKAYLYIAPQAVNDDIVCELKKDNVFIKPYLQIYQDLKELTHGKALMLDERTVNAALFNSVPDCVEIINHINPTTTAKAVKTPVEMENVRTAHIQDGVAVTKLLYWLKQIQKTNAYKNGEITEQTVSEKLLSFRKERSGFICQSFSPIIASGFHGAIVHYEPSDETDIPIENNNFLLMDTGGQYFQGTTDITRTVAMGNLTKEQKIHYTAVLKGNLNLAATKFKYGCTGVNLDYIARQPLWQLGLDYNHGTGHGVGYLLNVHEGPQQISFKTGAGRESVAFEEGMLTSDEPGLYLEGKYGIRLENLMFCVKAENTQFGQFMKFETVTMVPFDRDAILAENMTINELKLLNKYHSDVYKAISPYLTEEERLWLKKETEPY